MRCNPTLVVNEQTFISQPAASRSYFQPTSPASCRHHHNGSEIRYIRNGCQRGRTQWEVCSASSPDQLLVQYFFKEFYASQIHSVTLRRCRTVLVRNFPPPLFFLEICTKRSQTGHSRLEAIFIVVNFSLREFSRSADSYGLCNDFVSSCSCWIVTSW